MCNLKSLNLASLINSGPCPGLVNTPFSTVHATLEPGSLIFHPAKSFPQNTATGFAHRGERDLFSEVARRPVQVHGVPSCPVVVPTSILPESLPSKTMSSFRSSSSLGETKVTVPFESSNFGSDLACSPP